MSRWENEDRYERQSDIVREAIAKGAGSLGALLRGMRESGESAVYFCGSRRDHDLCFESDEVGWLVTALPEDGPKAATPGYHPGSTETYIPFQGRLTMEILDDGEVRSREIRRNEVLVLPPGQCHRVRLDPEQEAASLVVKTNLAHQPGVVRCDDCAYFPDASDCSLHQRWISETDR
jgi:mannose-6-phosphate isomerase-like protein (cupin superfamily)